jgi:hypothetical protein
MRYGCFELDFEGVESGETRGPQVDHHSMFSKDAGGTGGWAELAGGERKEMMLISSDIHIIMTADANQRERRVVMGL